MGLCSVIAQWHSGSAARRFLGNFGSRKIASRLSWLTSKVEAKVHCL